METAVLELAVAVQGLVTLVVTLVVALEGGEGGRRQGADYNSN